MIATDVEFLTEPRIAPDGRFAVFRDLARHHWDLITPTPGPAADTTAAASPRA